MKLLNNHRFGRGFTPKLIFVLKRKKALVMEFLAPTISSKFEKLSYVFTPKTICMLAMNIMLLVREFSSRTGCVHVDIKPSNICCSKDGRDIYLIDFGYS